MSWATKEQARAHWPDAASITDAVLDTLLEIATEQCAEFAPVQTEPLPTRYMLATVYQAREVYTASQRSEQDVIGIGDFAIRARPLSGSVKSLLRPSRGPRSAVG